MSDQKRYTIRYACNHILDNGGEEKTVDAECPECRLNAYNIVGGDGDGDGDEGEVEQEEKRQHSPSSTDSPPEQSLPKQSDVKQTPSKKKKTGVPSGSKSNEQEEDREPTRIQPKRKPSKGRPAVPGSREAEAESESGGDGEGKGEVTATTPWSAKKEGRGDEKLKKKE